MENVLSMHSRPLVGKVVSVVIVSCLKEDLLLDCLHSVSRQTYPYLECLVFLNCSEHKDLIRWQERFGGFKFFCFPDNQLYCKPHNQGIRISTGEYVLCLNDDVVLSPAYIEEAIKVMEADATLGILSGCLLRSDGETIDSAGLVWSKSRKPHDRGYGKRLHIMYQPGFVFGASGAAAFYRRRMLEDIKEGKDYFDESYGIFYEDFDLAWRARRMGWKAFFHPASIAIHKRGATTRTQMCRLLGFLKKFALVNLPHDLKLRLVRNRYATIIKNDTPSAFFMDLPWILFYEVRLLAYLILFDRRVLLDVAKDLKFFSLALAKRRAKNR
ncbi:MAG: glycosyltransferase [Candidatus Omnitrophica bacterium]|nr:glycosyltransferase [Candidatus Omnitrophota bacterium]